MTKDSVDCETSWMKGLISSAPRAQLRPTHSGSACSMLVMKASVVWPESVLGVNSIENFWLEF